MLPDAMSERDHRYTVTETAKEALWQNVRDYISDIFNFYIVSIIRH